MPGSLYVQLTLEQCGVQGGPSPQWKMMCEVRRICSSLVSVVTHPQIQPTTGHAVLWYLLLKKSVRKWTCAVQMHVVQGATVF